MYCGLGGDAWHAYTCRSPQARSHFLHQHHPDIVTLQSVDKVHPFTGYVGDGQHANCSREGRTSTARMPCVGAGTNRGAAAMGRVTLHTVLATVVVVLVCMQVVEAGVLECSCRSSPCHAGCRWAAGELHVGNARAAAVGMMPASTVVQILTHGDDGEDERKVDHHHGFSSVSWLQPLGELGVCHAFHKAVANE